MQLITTRKVARNHMIIKLINIDYIINFLYQLILYNKYIVIVISKSMHVLFYAK